MATTLSCVISRKVWFWPTCGLPWWSTLMSSIFRAAEIGQPGGRGERKARELGMRGVDDVRSEFDRVLGGRAGAGRVAGQRVDHPDLDGVGGAGCPCGHRSEQRDRQNAQCFHAILPMVGGMTSRFLRPY
jgi:hypothetical protein